MFKIKKLNIEIKTMTSKYTNLPNFLKIIIFICLFAYLLIC